MAEEQAGFELAWPAIAGRLERALRRRRVPEEFIDDVVQETALRLLRTWDSVDQTTLWPLTLTVAGNIIKDDMRRRGRDERLAAALPEAEHVDIEERALARLELTRVHKAFRFLSATQRDLLLAEVYGPSKVIDLSRGAMKMGRLRARRRLRQMMERASAVITLAGIKVRRLLDADGRGQLAEATSQGIAAAALVAAGVDLLVAGGGSSAIDRITNPPKEILRAVAPTNDSAVPDRAGVDRSRILLADAPSGPSVSFTDRSDVPDNAEILDHGEEVGPNGAEVWGEGTVLNQDAGLSTTVEHEPARCDEEDEITFQRGMICVGGGITVRVRIGHNGWSHTFEVSTDVRRGIRTE